MGQVSVLERAKGEVKKTQLRPDIQGLRALAVMMVIADHLFAYPSGGFVGVDVFFVISGFVITSSLLREQTRSGRISFANFYRRRARRILPLSVLVLITTVIASWLIFTSSRALRITEDGVWAMLFGANWHFALDGTNYMAADGTISPLQHFWSLAVEEQFYLVWPVLVMLVMGALALRLRWRAGTALAVLGVTVGAVSIASFGFAMWETANAPTFAYFSTFSRAWELGAGGLLAVCAPALIKIPAGWRPVLAWVGLAGIGTGAFLITAESPFPGPWAALPVLATMAVIAAGTGGSHAYLRPITNPVAGYVGNISYSLYLWHFPVIVLLGAVRPLTGPLDYVVFLLIIIGLSALSYYYLEDPIHHSNWLEPGRKSRGPDSHTRRRLGTGAVVALALATTLVTGAVVAKSNSYDPTAYVSAPSPTVAETKSAPSTPDETHRGNISAALSQATWPELSPSVNDLGPQAKAPEWVVDGCLGLDSAAREDPVENAQHCTYGDSGSSKTAVVLGDSLAISYVPGIRAALEPQGYSVTVYTVQQCPAEAVTVLKGDKSPHPDCDVFRQWAMDSIADLQPDLVIMASNQGAPLASGATGDAAALERAAGAKATFDALTASSKKTVVLTPPPEGVSLEACATRASRPADCVTGAHKDDDRTISAIKTEAEAANVRVIDTTVWFCVSGRCPSFIGTTPVYADGHRHLTSRFSSSLAPLMAEALLE